MAQIWKNSSKIIVQQVEITVRDDLQRQKALQGISV